MRQLGSALVALVIMLACAALSERLTPAAATHQAIQSERIVPAVATQQAFAAAVPRGPLTNEVRLTADVAVAVLEPRTARDTVPRDTAPPSPGPLVMLLAGSVLMGLGGALRTPPHDR